MHVVLDLFDKVSRYLPLILMPTAKYSGCVTVFIYDAHNIENIKDSTATALSRTSDPIILTHKTTCNEVPLQVFSAEQPLKSGDSQICIGDTFSRKIDATDFYKHISLLWGP